MNFTIIIYFLIVLAVTYPVVGKAFYKKSNFSGIFLSLAIGILAYTLGKLIPIVGGPVFGILLGIAVSFWKRPTYFNGGIKITGKKLLQAAIVLLGFEMNLSNVLRVGSQSLVVMLSTVTVCFVTAYWVTKWLKNPVKVATLIGVGTCICGGSAIAAAAPVINAEDDEVATAISTIFFYNIMAALIFPVIGRLTNMTDIGFGIWAGTAINDTSSVVAAAYCFSDAAGSLATIVKLTRTLLIIPVTFMLAVYTAKNQKNSQSNFSIVKVFPWFVIGFIIACLINTAEILPVDMTGFLGKSGKFMIVMAMSAIGLNTNVNALIHNGKKPLALGAICWFMIAVTSIIVQRMIGLM
ncbi:MAG: YeiH family putative sulfate export transporter [Tissierellales bacterium]|nr:YeiH family putative sulfate export transporter [Tissierellales bacterium]MBN2826473.1 YeiH family putative sulfate export transporter [Tissierellales bacterium]